MSASARLPLLPQQPVPLLGKLVPMNIAATLALLLAAALQGDSSSANVASAWRRPTFAELDQPWRRKSRDRFAVVRGDFDGDGKPDEGASWCRTTGAALP